MHFCERKSLSAFLFFFIRLSKSYDFDKFQLLGPVGQRVGNTIQWLSVNKMHCAIHRIEIYPVESIICYPLYSFNNLE